MGFFRQSFDGRREIAPEEIFLDSSNLPSRDDLQFEARVVRPLGSASILAVGIAFSIVVIIFIGRALDLTVLHGEAYADISRENRLERTLTFATRGAILDRTGQRVAWSVAQESATSTPGESEEEIFALRHYSDLPGLALLLGFVRYPKADPTGSWWREETVGVSGVEAAFDRMLAGLNGSTMVERDARGKIEARNIVEPPQHGTDVRLSIDAEVQSKLFSFLFSHAATQKFVGGAAAIMDVHTGEVIALTSFPEYDNAAFAAGERRIIAHASSDERSPMLNRAISGLYAPGSIVKPIFAAAALQEHIISPTTKILSTGAITIPNPYDPSHPSVYRDWSVHGLIDMREAIAVSSDEYFYTIGGGYGSQKGLGIGLLDTYARAFGLAARTGVELLGEETGIIPTPEWKAATFGSDDPWRIGNTYHTAIGQYGFQITPLQAVSFIAAVANGGALMRPTILASSTPEWRQVGVDDSNLQVVREGMRLAVTSSRRDATVKILNMSGIQIAAKTGTAQIGPKNEWINSWSVGFWPAEHPHYAYAAVLEKAPAGTLSGAAPGLRPFFEWLVANKPEYVK